MLLFLSELKKSFLANRNVILPLALLIVSLGAIPVILSSAAPPTGFQTTLVASGLNGPAGIEVAPDGRVFILERTGTVKIVKNGQLLVQPFVTLPSIASGDRGLIGIDFDPDYGVSNNWVYFYYTGLDLLNHIVRFDASNDIGQNGPFEIFATQSPSQQLHVGGTIQFGPDGKLYFAVGDNGYPPNAQDLSNPHGKILRINKDGSIPTDNPFYGQAGKLGSIWAYGFRNPWRFQFDTQTGTIYGADVGDFTWEEVNKITRGANYGWPVHEGVCTANCAGYTNPVHTYAHNGQSASVTGGPVYRSSMFPAEYRGSYFFADYAQGFIKRATLNPDGSFSQVYDFDNAAGAVVDMKTAVDGSMYYITYFPGRLYRISHNQSNPGPTAIATASVTHGAAAPLTVNFSSAGSVDPNGDPLTYTWNFGDGSTSTAANPSHTYTTKGAFTVDLTISDSANTAQATPIVIQVGQPPVVTIATPAANSTYKAGDTITYNAFATDAAGFDLNDANIVTDIIFHHDTHTHPFIDNQIGRVGSFTIPDTGEAAANTWYEIAVSASDASGVSTTNSINIYPQTVNMTYQTQPAGLNIQLDGVPHTSPYTVPQVVNFKREINAPATQTASDGTVYTFKQWSDGGTIRHFLVTPATNTTITAIYEPAGTFVGEYFNNQNLSGSPTLVRSDTQVNFAWGLGAPAPTLPVNNFSVRWTKNQHFVEGRYTFTTGTDDGVRLYIDGRLVIDKWQDQGVTAWTHTEYLQSGPHEIRMEYYENSFDAAAQLSWVASTDQSPPTISGWRGEYFNNKSLSGTPTLIRGDQLIDFDWGLNAPAPSVNPENFSVRWSKTEVFESSTYRFRLVSDDGIRMYIDNQLAFDAWNDHGVRTDTFEKTLTAGPHDIRVEFYDSGFDAVAKMSYTKITGPPVETTYSATYFNNMTLSGTPVVSRSEPVVNNDWGLSAPAAGVNADQFSARWTKQILTVAGTYKFTVTGDDGMRLYVDNVLLIDQWKDQSTTTYTFNVSLGTGNHDIRFEYYENRFDAVAKMSYAATNEPPQTPPGAEPLWQATYFANKTLSGAPTVTQNEPKIDYYWGSAAPVAGIPADVFSVRWTKTHSYAAGSYMLTATSDDGIRVFIDGNLTLNAWTDHGATTFTAPVTLTAGSHTIVVEYYENTHDAVAKFSMVKL